MTGAYAHDWPGRGAWADDSARGCGPREGRGRHGDWSDEGRHGGGPRDERGGPGGRGGRGRGGRGDGPGFPIEALAGWMMSRGGGGRPGHGRHGHGPSPEDLDKLEAIMALRGMRGRGQGPFGRGPRGRGRRRRGDVRLAVLRLLSEDPRNGYQLMQAIEERSGGRWRPSPGSMYPTLSQLEDEGLIRSTDHDGGRRFEITDEGRAALDARSQEPDPWASEPDADEHAMSELGPLVVGIGKATWQVASVADEGQRAEAAELLAETRRRLYAILAQEPTTATDAATEAAADSAGSEEDAGETGEPRSDED